MDCEHSSTDRIIITITNSLLITTAAGYRIGSYMTIIGDVAFVRVRS